MGDYGFPGGEVHNDRYQVKYGKPPPTEILALMPSGVANMPGDGEPPTAAIGE